jgi:O-antigen ligase
VKRPVVALDPLQTPFWLLILSYSFLYVRWQDIIPGLGATRVTGLLTYGLMLWFLLKGDRTILTREPLIRYSVIFVGLMAISVTWAVHVSAFFTTEYVVLIVLSFEVPLVYLLRDWNRTVIFFRYWVLIQLLVALWALRTNGVGGGDFLADENDLSLAMSMALPYPIYVMSMSGCPPKWRLICRATVLAIVSVIIISFSRGGFVGMLSVISMMWVFSKNKVRNLLIALVVALLGGALILKMLPASYGARLDSMFDPTNSTRVERLRSWEIARIMWRDNPIFGVGAAQFPWNVQHYERLTSYWLDDIRTKSLSGRQVHSLYFSLLADMGLVGCTVVALLLIGIVRALLRVILLGNRLARGPPGPKAEVLPKTQETVRIEDSALLAKAILCSLIGFLVSGAFISVAYYPHIWIMAGFATVIKNQGVMRVDAHEEPAPTRKVRNGSYIGRSGLRAGG